ncbi:MAG: hypothetical protein QN206_12530 [Armatimonadota bacterium]|nr:hypothetical protein [Armatimonadota bacterium]
MAAFTLGPEPIARGEVVWPRVGRPHATLLLGVPHEEVRVHEGEQHPLALRGEDRTLTLVGTVMRLEHTPDGWPLVRWVGGKGKLNTSLRPRHYRNVPARVVLGDAIRDGGEEPGQLDAPQLLPVWVRLGEPLRVALQRLCTALGLGWRVTPDGKVDVGPSEWRQGGVALAAQSRIPGMWMLPLDLEVEPGQEVALRLGGKEERVRVERVVHRIGRELVTEVWRA